MNWNEKIFTIYAIRCKENGKLYIGRTLNLDNRIQCHFQELNSGRHKNKSMLEDYQKYGRDKFEIYVLEENVPYKDRSKEFDYMKQYNTFEDQYGYNRGDRKQKNKTTYKYIYSLPPNLYQTSQKVKK